MTIRCRMCDQNRFDGVAPAFAVAEYGSAPGPVGGRERAVIIPLPGGDRWWFSFLHRSPAEWPVIGKPWQDVAQRRGTGLVTVLLAPGATLFLGPCRLCPNAPRMKGRELMRLLEESRNAGATNIYVPALRAEREGLMSVRGNGAPSRVPGGGENGSDGSDDGSNADGSGRTRMNNTSARTLME